MFEIRSNHTSLVYDNKMWIIGGWQAVINPETMVQDVTSFADVWYSENGTQWNKLSVSESYLGRLGHASTIFENKILISGGLNIDQDDNLRSHYNDVWIIE